MSRLGRKADPKRGLHSGPVQCGVGKPVSVMWVRSLLLSAIIALSAGIAPASATTRAQLVQPTWVMPVQDRGAQREIRPLREVVDYVRSRYGGELISARLEDGPRPVYVLRWQMPNGEVRDIRVDAAR
jgi:hypothetical protein